MWKQLWEEGVRGKIWRVIKGMYSVVQSSVLVGEERTEMFDLQTGVRQGCVMSPILFSFFINGLAKEIKRKTKGVPIGENRVRLLLYADDIVLLAETQKDLQDMLNIVTSYSKKWRFRVNPKKGKSEVMIFGRKPRKTVNPRKWSLAGVEIEETEMYKYLGVELVSALNFKLMKSRLVAEARKRMMLVWAMGMRRGELPVADCRRSWNALVRPVLEYGAVVWGDAKWEEAEAVQREMGKMILRCSSKMANEVVLGELGWWTLKGRDMLRLRFWGKVGRMSSRRLVKQVYTHSRARFQAGESSKWCKYTYTLLKQLGMEDTWEKEHLTEEEVKEFEREIRDKIHSKEEIEWKERMLTKPKLRTYRTLKHTLEFEQEYLSYHDRQAREVMTRIRGGTHELRIETGRYPNTNKDTRLELHERRCLLCMSGEIEDEHHFLLECIVYDDLRRKMFDVVKTDLLKKEEKIEELLSHADGRQRILEGLLGEAKVEGEAALNLRYAALRFCKRAMTRRNGIVLRYLDQRT